MQHFASRLRRIEATDPRIGWPWKCPPLRDRRCRYCASHSEDRGHRRQHVDRRRLPRHGHAPALALRPPRGSGRAGRTRRSRAASARVGETLQGAVRGDHRRLAGRRAVQHHRRADLQRTSTSGAAATPSTAPAHPRCWRSHRVLRRWRRATSTSSLAGGVDLSIDPFELIGFAKCTALARERMRVYDRKATGFLPGEGCGFVVLMRHGRRSCRADAALTARSPDGGSRRTATAA